MTSLSDPTGSSLVGFIQDATGAVATTVLTKLRERLTFADFGAFGVVDASGVPVTDETDVVQAALDWASQADRILEASPGQRFLISSTVTVKLPGQVRMNHARFVTATSFVEGTAVLIKNTQVSGHTNAVEHRRLDIAVQGPYGGESLSAPPNIDIDDYYSIDGIVFDGSTNQISGTECRLWSEGFRYGVDLGPVNFYLNSFPDIHSAKHWMYGVRATQGTNSGENLAFFGGVIANCINSLGTAVGVYGSGLNQTSLYFKGVSFDYCDNFFYWNGTDGQLVLDTCHLENNNINAMGILNTDSSYAQVTLRDCNVVMGSGGSGYIDAAPSNGREAIFRVTGSGNGDFKISGGVQLYGKGKTELISVEGAGATSISTEGLFATAQIHQPPLISDKLNRLYNGSFELGDFTSWLESLSSGQTFVVDGTVYPPGETQSAKLVGTIASATGGISQSTNVYPGQRVILRCLVLTSGVTSGAVDLNARFFDVSGNAISAQIIDGIGSAATDWTLVGGSIVVPPGAAQLRCDCFITGFVGAAWIGKVSVCVL